MHSVTDLIADRIAALDEQQPHALAVLGGAVFAWEHRTNLNALIEYLLPVIERASLAHWKEGPANACRTFCNLCMVDPGLVESYIGMRFEDLAQYHLTGFIP